MSKRPIVFVVLPDYADWEGSYAAYAISKNDENQHVVRTASFSADPITSGAGYSTYPDFTLDRIPVDYAGIILLGGPGWQTDRQRIHEVEPLVRACYEQGRLLGGIGAGVNFLAASGLLNDVFHTGNSIEELRSYAGPAYDDALFCSNAGAVRDGNVVTAAGPFPLAFAGSVLEVLEDPENTQGAAWYDRRGVRGSRKELQHIA